jgi:uncharacterized protein YfiM (DUF2279 family)
MFSFEKFELDKDKANHFVYGSVITLCALTFTGSLVFSLSLCGTIAVLKEVWDLFYGSGFDWLDIVWTVLGSAVVLASFFITQR